MDGFDRIKARTGKVVDITTIPEEETWLTGYISANLLEADFRARHAVLHKLGLIDAKEIERETRLRQEKRFRDPKKLEDEVLGAVKGILQKSGEGNFDALKWKSRLEEIKNKLNDFQKKLERAEEIGKSNTEIYLSWEHLDIYFATSMRHKWEFEDVYGFIRSTFAQNSLDNLRAIRYFDPTQSFSDNRIDKGLVEGLMLNRAALTVYLAQETDTLGKDSELAATLAQGKPVIAYVPPVDEKYEQRLPSKPLDFFLKRFYLLQADDAFKKPKCNDEMLKKFGGDALTRLGEYVDRLSRHISDRTFNLVGNEDNEFKSDNSKMFMELCQMLTVAERHYFDGRAYTLQKVHPLAVQVNLRNGVANGVLVVRSAKMCADLIRHILTNSMNFDIVNEQGVTELRERLSNCPFRVVTEDETLTNSFWNFYLTEQKRKIYSRPIRS